MPATFFGGFVGGGETGAERRLAQGREAHGVQRNDKPPPPERSRGARSETAAEDVRGHLPGRGVRCFGMGPGSYECFLLFLFFYVFLPPEDGTLLSFFIVPPEGGYA